MTPSAHFSFDTNTHTYRLGTAILPSVTQIVGRVIPRAHYADDWYLRRGSMVHKAVAMMLQNTLDWSTVDPRILGFVKAAGKALTDNFSSAKDPLACTWTDFECERADYHRILNYAGTFDLFYRGTLIDWKCSNEPQTAIQLGAYTALIEQEPVKVKECAAVELHADGTYRMDHYKPAKCKALFMAAYTIYGWMKENKIKENDNGPE